MSMPQQIANDTGDHVGECIDQKRRRLAGQIRLPAARAG